MQISDANEVKGFYQSIQNNHTHDQVKELSAANEQLSRKVHLISMEVQDLKLEIAAIRREFTKASTTL